MIPSSALTLTLMVLAPTDSATCCPVAPMSASVSVASFSSRYATVALAWVVAEVTVMVPTLLPTVAVYPVTLAANAGASVPALMLSALSVASVERGRVTTSV